MAQFQPDPADVDRARPAGNVSVTVTVPVVGPVPLFDTTIVNGRPTLTLNDRVGMGLDNRELRPPRIVVGSGAEGLGCVSPPPLTVAMLVVVTAAGPT